MIRTSSFLGPWDDFNFVTGTLRALQQRQELKVAQDIFISPTYVPDLVNCTIDLLIDGESGTKRPLFSALKSGKGLMMPSLEQALDRYFISI